MRNFVYLIKSLLAAAGLAGLIAGGISTAQAGPAIHTVPDALSGMPCGLLDGNGVVRTSPDFKITNTQNQHGNATFQCKGNVPPADSGGAVHWDATSATSIPQFSWMSSVPCALPVPDPTSGSPFTMTDHWDEVVSASGEATMTCHLP